MPYFWGIRHSFSLEMQVIIVAFSAPVRTSIRSTRLEEVDKTLVEKMPDNLMTKTRLSLKFRSIWQITRGYYYVGPFIKTTTSNLLADLAAKSLEKSPERFSE